MTHPNAERLRAALVAYNEGDHSKIEEALHDDVIWHVGGSHELSGTYRGRDAVLRYMSQVSDLTGGSLRLDPIAVMADDERGGAFLRVTGSRGGHSVAVTLAEALRFDSDGKWIEYWARADRQEALDRFFAPNAAWFAAGPAGMSGEFRGRDAVERFLGACVERSNGSLRMELEAELNDGDYTVAFLRMTGRNATGELDAHVAQFTAHSAEPQVERCWFLAADTAAWNAFFAV